MEIEEEYDCCPVCYENHGQAYNGILQLRNPTEDAVLLVEFEIDRHHEKGSYCIKKLKVKNGYDYFFTSSQFARFIGKRLEQEIGGELEITAKLVSRSRQSSKDLYRVTIMFRVPNFKKGEIVNFKGKDVEILNFGKKVFVKDAETNKKLQVPYDQLRRKND